ncbi:hypothetical protein CRE_18859 [Caenorhabditis remanei]|uniref:Uncharacterized protein n=1 Tax=Caenorhabditis remanei TaxID=31234 RepID=E3LL79_CAERE|nr:hypothetical protein CRE_18859 [Caenorhabditis remanei]
MNVFLLLVGFGLVSGFPSDENGPPKRPRTESPENVGKSATRTVSKPTSTTIKTPSVSPTLSTQQPLATDCYFSKIRKSNLEQLERSFNAKVSTQCDGATMK